MSSLNSAETQAITRGMNDFIARFRDAASDESWESERLPTLAMIGARVILEIAYKHGVSLEANREKGIIATTFDNLPVPSWEDLTIRQRVIRETQCLVNLRPGTERRIKGMALKSLGQTLGLERDLLFVQAVAVEDYAERRINRQGICEPSAPPCIAKRGRFWTGGNQDTDLMSRYFTDGDRNAFYQT